MRLFEDIRRDAERILQNAGASAMQVGLRDYANSLEANARWDPSGIRFRMELTSEEARYGEASRWLRILDVEARAHALENRLYELELILPAPRFVGIDPASGDDVGMMVTMERLQNESLRITGIQEIPARTERTANEAIMSVRHLDPRNIYLSTFTRPDDKAEKKAKALFKRVAGGDALYKLNRGGLPLKGSIGGEYVLHPKMTYCVDRKDGAKLCAVVPNVPLYDHLLGIKVMIENDEPEFLRTANVAGVFSFPQEFRDEIRRHLVARNVLFDNLRGVTTAT